MQQVEGGGGGGGGEKGRAPRRRESQSARPAWWKEEKLVGLPSTWRKRHPLRVSGRPAGRSGLMTVTRVPLTANSARPAASSSTLSPHPTTCASTCVHDTHLYRPISWCLHELP